MMNPVCVVDFPDQFRNDIFYCQRALREHIKIHQFCAIQQTVKPRRHYAKTIQIIEREMQAISRDQRTVIDQMKKYLRNTVQANQQQLEDDAINNQIIGAYLDQHRPSITGLVLQPSGLVKARATEKELMKRFNLLQDLQRFMRPGLDKALNLGLIDKPRKSVKGNQPAAAVNESRQKLMAALQFAKTRPQAAQIKLEESDDDEDMELMPSPLSDETKPSIMSGRYARASMVEPNLKRGRGRPRKLAKFRSAGSSSAPNTRPASPEVIMPWVELPPEPEETNDHNITSFLQLFGLYTKDAYERLKSKRPERRRRNVQSTEKTDFHYGQLESINAMKDRIPYSIKLGGIRKKGKPIQQYLSPKVFRKRRTFEHSSTSSSPTDLSQLHIKIEA